VKTGLKTILGDTSAGESYDEKFFVCIKQFVVIGGLSVTKLTAVSSNAIIRVDMFTYK